MFKTKAIKLDSSIFSKSMIKNPDFKIPETIWAIGNIKLLKFFHTSLAVFCSNRCPGSLILKSYDFAQELSKTQIPVLSSFHSAVEREILRILLEGNNPLIICPARSIHNMRIPKEFNKKFTEGKLLFISPFEKKFRRPTVKLSRKRNLMVAALAFKILIIHAAEGSKTEKLAKSVSKWDKDIFTFDDPANARLFELGLLPSTRLIFNS